MTPERPILAIYRHRSQYMRQYCDPSSQSAIYIHSCFYTYRHANRLQTKHILVWSIGPPPLSLRRKHSRMGQARFLGMTARVSWMDGQKVRGMGRPGMDGPGYREPRQRGRALTRKNVWQAKGWHGSPSYSLQPQSTRQKFKFQHSNKPSGHTFQQAKPVTIQQQARPVNIAQQAKPVNIPTSPASNHNSREPARQTLHPGQKRADTKWTGGEVVDI